MNKTAREIELEKKVTAGLRCEKIHLNRALRAEKKLEIAIKALKKMINYNSVAEQTDKYYYIVLDVREIGKKALNEIEK